MAPVNTTPAHRDNGSPYAGPSNGTSGTWEQDMGDVAPGRKDTPENSPSLHWADIAQATSLSESGSQRLLLAPDFPKANSAIHVYPTKDNYSLLMRKCFNVLLAASHRQLASMPAGTYQKLLDDDRVLRFEAPTSLIMEKANWSSTKDYTGVYAVLDALQTLQVVWDCTSNTDGSQQWRSTASLLSQWYRTSSGRIGWLWVPDLFAKLFDPRRAYTPIDLRLNAEFTSKYTLALFENVIRYKNMPLGTTPWKPVEFWRLVVAGPTAFKDFRELKRAALTTAMDEIKKTPSCPVEFTMQSQKGARGAITALRFTISQKRQAALGMDLPATTNPALPRELREIGLAADMVARILAQHDARYVQKKLTELKRHNAISDVRNPAGLLIWMLGNDAKTAREASLSPQSSPSENQASPPGVPALAGQASAPQPVAQLFNEPPALTPAQRAALIERFNSTACPEPVRSLYRKNGEASRTWSIAWRQWLAMQKEGIGVDPEG